jgi:hypothetical protein
MFEIIRLKHAIHVEHQCRAEHTNTKLIVERAPDGSIWRGTVHGFDLVDHSEAQRCYGWIEKINRLPICVTRLKLAPVTSAQTAVREVLLRRRALGQQRATA